MALMTMGDVTSSQYHISGYFTLIHSILLLHLFYLATLEISFSLKTKANKQKLSSPISIFPPLTFYMFEQQ